MAKSMRGHFANFNLLLSIFDWVSQTGKAVLLGTRSLIALIQSEIKEKYTLD